MRTPRRSPLITSKTRNILGIGLTLAILALLTFAPFIMLFQLSLKSTQQIADSMWLPSLPFHFKNYWRAFYMMRPYLLNSVIFCIGTATISILCSSLTGYALSRYQFPGRELFYYLILALMMIPGILTLITRFVTVVKLHLNNTNFGIWFPLAAMSQGFEVIVLRTFFTSVPEELFESARIDGADEFRMLYALALPLSRPIITTLVVLSIMSTWNEFIWPTMVFGNSAYYPAILIVQQLGATHLYNDPGAMYAGYVLAGLPLLLLFALTSQTFVRGLTSGAIKM